MKAVILVRAAGDGCDLLANGPCGARPPIASQVPNFGAGDEWRWQAGDARGSPTDIKAIGLVLMWNGALVPEGMERARARLADLDCGGSADGVRFKPGIVAGTWSLFGDDYSRHGAYETYSHLSGYRAPIAALCGVTNTAEALAVICQHRGLGRLVIVRSNQ